MQPREYNPNACIICDATTGLKRCSRCQMISYCSSLHQKKHWSEHKDLCGTISLMMKEREVSHLFENLRGADLDTWRKEKMNMMKEAETRVGRMFQMNDAFLFKRPRSCFVCHESRQELLKNCPGCPIASFCKDHPNSPIHDEDCVKIRESFTFIKGISIDPNFLLTMTISIRKFLLLLKMLKPSDLPVSMSDLMSKFTQLSRFTTPLPEILKFPMSEMFTTSMTVFNALQRLEFPPASELTIHVRDPVESIPVAPCEALLHLFKNIKTLKMLFFDSTFKTNDNCLHLDLCPECTDKGKKITIRYLEHSYDLCMNGNYEEPDLLFYRDVIVPEKDVFSTYGATNLLKLWTRLSCPLIITTLTEGDHNLMKKTIKSILGNVEFSFDGCNSFRSFIYTPNDDDGRVGCSNNYMMLLKSNDQLKQKFLNVKIGQLLQKKKSTEENVLNSTF